MTPALEMVERVEYNHLLERKAVKEYERRGVIETKGKRPEDRIEMENTIYNRLNRSYPLLKPWEVVIDIPEPISFETHISIYSPDGTVSDISDEEMVFTGEISSLFQKSLRKVALYVPAFVSEEEARKAMGEVIYG